jgi:hypothetical protein
MFTVDQLQDFIGPLIAAGCIGLFAVGVSLAVVAFINRSEAGPSRRRSQHRKGARFHKPTHIPVQVKTTHPHTPVAFLHAHVHRTRIQVLPVTEILPKIGAKHANK